MYPPSVDLYPRLLTHLAAHPDRKGWVHVACPNCGKPAKRGQTHFAFNERYGHCFVCGHSTGLGRLAATVGLEWPGEWHPTPRPTRTPEVQPERHYSWQDDPGIWRTFRPLPRVALDYYHSRGFTDNTIDEWHLGYGALPSSHCHHERAILPVFESGRLVAIRGRALAADEPHEKWLCSGGSKTVLLGAERLKPGRTVVVAEAPYSAILAMQVEPLLVAVAGTGGAGCWHDEWSARIAASEPAWILVWYDHDSEGERGDEKVRTSLVRAGLRPRVWHWRPGDKHKRDLADIVAETSRVPVIAARPQLQGVDSAYL